MRTGTRSVPGFSECCPTTLHLHTDCRVCQLWVFYFDKYKENAKKTIANQKTKTIQKTRRKNNLKSKSSRSLPSLSVPTKTKKNVTTTITNQKTNISSHWLQDYEFTWEKGRWLKELSSKDNSEWIASCSSLLRQIFLRPHKTCELKGQFKWTQGGS